MAESADQAKQPSTAQERAEFALKLLGASAVLTALMGWPAVSVQFAAFGIPADFIEVRAAVRAGIPPAVGFMLVFGYGLFLRRFVTRLPQQGPASLPLFVLLVAQAFVLFVPSVLVQFGGLFSAAYLSLHWVSSYFGARVEAVWWIVGACIVSALFAAWAFNLPERILTRSEIQEVEITEDSPGEAEVYETDWRRSLLYAKLILSDYLTFVVLVVSLGLIAWCARIYWPGVFAWLTVPTALFLGAVLTIFSALFPLMMFLRRVDSELVLGNLQAMRGFLVLSAGLAVLFFSTDLYPQLTKDWGGGRPAPVSVLLYADKAPALAGWPVSVENAQVRLAPVYLIEMEGEHLILTDRDAPPGQWIAVPQDAVVSVGEP